ncbi:cobalamin-dependent protein, partial [Pseudobutyrivibrio sp.]|uniref:cobalamin-dependent protein n=1 Tax=Pseudobutyrivibrio sp. TaxID=2014367 RepID=UPI001B526669
DINEKKQHINTVLTAAESMGLRKEDAVVDVLVQTVGAEGTAGLQCFETIEYCKNELGLPTVCGLSNISFGMPNRPFVNTTYLTIAVSKGLTMAIANPSQQMLMYCAAAADTLMNKPGALEKYASLPVVEQAVGAAAGSKPGAKEAGGDAGVELSPVAECVVKGKKEQIVTEIQSLLDSGVDPQVIIEEHLIKGINVVGDLYDKKKYFLPQLIAGANAMEIGMKHIEPLLASEDSESKGTIVIATVEGDIHDIGKNLVALMLKNYGYNVIDLGKDVPAAEIIDKAVEVDADIIGLSALMTTTMMRMDDVVKLAKEKGCRAQIIIGGACINESFKDEINADGYSADAADCVKLVANLLKNFG